MPTFRNHSSKRFLSCLLFIAVITGCAAITPKEPASRKQKNNPVAVILVSIDGFMPEYLQRGVTPNLNFLAANGVRAVAMRPSFPSITFPNHYSLVTGLRPDKHGIVGNTMEDTKIPGVRFSLGNKEAVTDRRWWDQAEPVWVTAEKQGVRTATMFWPGSEAQIHGVRPAQWLPFDGKLPASARVETVLQWLDQSEPARPAFLTLYFDEVDHAGHEFGPGDAQTTQAVARVDDAIGQLMAGLEKRHLAANIVIVSDHGMAATSSERLIELDQLTPPSSYRLVNGGTYAGIEATPGQESLLASALTRQHEHMQCWPKAEIPARFHYGHNSRVPAYICLAEVGWLIFPNNNSGKKWQGGAHGYDNLAPEMQSLFIASGPAFNKAIVLPPFDNVDVYPLIMQLIGVAALPSDGVITPILPAMQQRTQ